MAIISISNKYKSCERRVFLCLMFQTREIMKEFSDQTKNSATIPDPAEHIYIP